MKSKQVYGRDITFRLPYTMVQEVTFGSEEKDIDVEGFVWRMDKPLDVQRFVIQLTALDGDAVIDPQPTVLGHFLSNISIYNWDTNEMHGSTGGVAFRVYDNMLLWEPETELVIFRAGGFKIKFTSRKFDISPALKLTNKLRIRAVVSVAGDAVVVAPPSA
jgi:hypothetical protein